MRQLRYTLFALLSLLVVASPAAAQFARPLVGTTLTLTDTSADALHVGCAVGSSTCTGGVKAGTVAATTYQAGGVTPSVTPNGFGLYAQHSGLFAPLEFYDSGAASNKKFGELVWGAGVFSVRLVNDAVSATTDAISVTADGSSTPLATIALKGALITNAIITPAALAGGNNNDYNPTGLSTAFMVRVTKGAASVITGIAGGVDGRRLMFCPTNTTTVPFSNEDANSTAANRIILASAATSVLSCVEFVYDGTRARWMEIGGLK